MNESFLDLYEKADKSLNIAKSTADALIEAHHGKYGFNSNDTIFVLMGIIEKIYVAKDCINKMYDGNGKGGDVA